MWTLLRRSPTFWFGLAFLIAAAGMVPVILVSRTNHQRLVASGEVTDAAVLDRHERKEEEATKHLLEIQYYDLQLNQFQRMQPVSLEMWEAHPPGSLIRVRYLREDPEKMQLEATIGSPEWKDLLIMTIAFGFVGVTVVGLSVIRAGRSLGAPQIPPSETA